MARNAKRAGSVKAEQPKPIRQAVVVFHGMGEQRPMDTLRSYVESLFVKDRTVGGRENQVWSVPDEKGLSYELRRLSTPVSKGNVRTDFFEFYYSDIMTGHKMSQLRAWVMDLLLRRPEDVPRRMMWPWFVLWLLTFFVIGAFAVLIDLRGYLPFAGVWTSLGHLPVWIWVLIGLSIAGILYKAKIHRSPTDPRSILAVCLALLGGLVVAVLLVWEPSTAIRFVATAAGFVFGIVGSLALRYFGDVARYVRAAPDTVQARHDVRARGLSLLEGLHDGRYERIVVVAHSLGTIVAYDLLNLLWHRLGPTSSNPPEPDVVAALEKIDDFLPENSDTFDLEEFRKAQWDVFLKLRESRKKEPATPRKPWLISDFVTLGSPLSHAEFLVERNRADFEKAQRELELAVSPPLANIIPANVIAAEALALARERPSILFSHPQTGSKAAHHAAMFAAVRWTNIYDPYSYILLGDLVSGPVGKTGMAAGFGVGIRDVEVKMRHHGLWGRVFTHTLYGQWQPHFDQARSPEHFAHILALRQAVDFDALSAQPHSDASEEA